MQHFGDSSDRHPRPVRRLEGLGNDYMEIAVCKLDVIRSDQ